MHFAELKPTLLQYNIVSSHHVATHKKRYQNDISFLCPLVINLIKAQVRDKKQYHINCDHTQHQYDEQNVSVERNSKYIQQ